MCTFHILCISQFLSWSHKLMNIAIVNKYMNWRHTSKHNTSYNWSHVNLRNIAVQTNCTSNVGLFFTTIWLTSAVILRYYYTQLQVFLKYVVPTAYLADHHCPNYPMIVYPHLRGQRVQYLVCVCVCLSVCYHKIAAKFNYLKI